LPAQLLVLSTEPKQRRDNSVTKIDTVRQTATLVKQSRKSSSDSAFIFCHEFGQELTTLGFRSRERRGSAQGLVCCVDRCPADPHRSLKSVTAGSCPSAVRFPGNIERIGFPNAMPKPEELGYPRVGLNGSTYTCQTHFLSPMAWPKRWISVTSKSGGSLWQRPR